MNQVWPIPGLWSELLAGVADASRWYTRCHVTAAHFLQRISRVGFPAAFQRMPPASQTEISAPQGQRIFHLRESASIAAAHFFGASAMMTFCMKLIGSPSGRFGIAIRRHLIRRQNRRFDTD
jgi:hypothetical protein